MTKQLSIGLIGNPNCGKTAIFNRLTGSHQRVGNWPGVTVDKHTGHFQVRGQRIELIDLPGCYSTVVTEQDGPLDERIACEFLLSNQADAYINVIDACNMQRNLYLTMQLIELGKPVIIAVNMLDLAKKRGLFIQLEQLATLLGCPVVGLIASSGEGISTLRQCCAKLPDPAGIQPTVFPDNVAQAANVLSADIAQEANFETLNAWWLALRMLEGDQWVLEHASASMRQKVQERLTYLQKSLPEDCEIMIADARYQRIHQLTKAACTPGKAAAIYISQHIDRWVLNRWIGIPCFLTMMYALFLFAVNLGGAFQPFFEHVGYALFVQWPLVKLHHMTTVPVWLDALITGVGEGLTTTLTFIPIIAAMFWGLNWLEDCGYMARAAFVVDRVMRALGLPGKAFVSMVVGFGCNVPAVMATRTLENHRDRVLTAMMAPFMSCSARLTIYAVFVAAFFPRGGHNIIFLLYMIGIAVAMMTGLMLRVCLLPGDATPLVMELPPYHLPQLAPIARRTWQRMSGFVKRAGCWIVPVCAALGVLNQIPWPGDIVLAGGDAPMMHPSVLAVFGHWLTQFFTPIGLQQDNWPATVGLVTGVLAKEVVIGTLNSLYSQLGHWVDATSAHGQLWDALKEAVLTIPHELAQLPKALSHPLSANAPQVGLNATAYGQLIAHFHSRAAVMAYLLFTLLYFPCISTMAAMRRELSSGWAYFSMVWATLVAYGVALVYYQVMTFERHPAASLELMLLVGLMITFVCMRLRCYKADGEGGRV